MERDMANVYRKMSDDQLRKLRSKKFVRLQKINQMPGGFFIRKERAVLEHQIHQADVELNARFLQLRLIP